jgi:uncharacterized repeat protein (TIGR03803 family)
MARELSQRLEQQAHLMLKVECRVATTLSCVATPAGSATGAYMKGDVCATQRNLTNTDSICGEHQKENRMTKVNFNWWKTACAALLLSAATAIALPAQTFTTLVDFDGTDGQNPFYVPLVQGTDGNLYGTTPYGGANRAGTVFKMTPSGTLTTLYSFCAQSDCTDGETPETGLVLGTDSNFYGTTYAGGSGAGCTGGCGTVFKITSGGKLTTLHSFDETDGASPYGRALIQATNGSFYGTTSSGGVVGGTVFKITSGGAFTLLHSFEGTDGSEPVGGVIQATDGNLYGTTNRGGADGVGTVFKITLAGTLTTLYSFCAQSGCTDGENPYTAGLVQASNGIFYGTTYDGGANNGGTVFKITSGGTLTTLYNFGSLDGFYPEAALIQATDGNFYGTTYLGGAGDEGSAFKMTSAGTLTTLHSFCSESGCADGGTPAGALVQATNGTFYGVTPGGGTTNGDGTVFSLAVGLGSFVETLPTSGKVAAAVKILGTNLTGATAVSFNGTAATFRVVSSSEITTTVPSGATTGFVSVTTPGGTLSSNVTFRVTR